MWALSSIGYGDPNDEDYEFRHYYATVDTDCITQTERDQLVVAGYQLDSNVRWLPYTLEYDPQVSSNSSFPSSMLEHECLFVVDYTLAQSLWKQYFDEFFYGNLSGAMHNHGISRYYGPQNLNAIYDYGNITFDRVDDIFRNISDSMTTYIRQAGHVNHSSPALGIVTRNETCLEVRWGWLALPAVLVAGTLVFFTAMIVETRPTGNRAQIWKSSPLALIFHGLEDPNRLHTNREMEGISDMERTAKGITVTLATTDTGVNLVRDGENGSKERNEVRVPTNLQHAV